MHIIVYGLIGLLLGGYITITRVSAGTGINVLCTVGIAALFTFLAMRYGDGFLRLFRNLVRALRS